MRLLMLVALFAAACAPAAAQPIQKWTDADGRVHYGQRPPPGQQTDPIQRGTMSSVDSNAAPAGAATPAGAPTSQQEREFQDRRRARLDREAGVDRSQAEARAAEARAREADARRQAEQDRRLAEQGAAAAARRAQKGY